MAIEQTTGKKGLLALGYQPGDSLGFVTEAGIPNRVDSQGLLEWYQGDTELVRLELEMDFKRYLSLQDDNILRKIFRSSLLFQRALMGNPTPVLLESWPILPFPIFEDPAAIPSVWRKAPYAVQTTTFDKARNLAVENLKKYYEDATGDNSKGSGEKVA